MSAPGALRMSERIAVTSTLSARSGHAPLPTGRCSTVWVSPRRERQAKSGSAMRFDPTLNLRLLGQLGVDLIHHLVGEPIAELAQLQQAMLELRKRRIVESLAGMRQAQRLGRNPFQRDHLLAVELRVLVEA